MKEALLRGYEDPLRSSGAMKDCWRLDSNKVCILSEEAQRLRGIFQYTPDSSLKRDIVQTNMSDILNSLYFYLSLSQKSALRFVNSNNLDKVSSLREEHL